MENEYYLINRDPRLLIPLVDEESGCRFAEEYLYRNYKKKIENPQGTARFRCDRPTVLDLSESDYFSQPSSIVSGKIRAVLEPMDIYGIQLVPAEIITFQGGTLPGFYYVHIYSWIKAMDMKNSNTKQLSNGTYMIRSFRLDNDRLREIPLNERLIFILEEDCGKMLYHTSVAEAIMAVNPTGVNFTKVEDWSL